MEEFKNQLVKINDGFYTDKQLVEYFQLIAEKLEIGSVQDIANDNGIKQQGVRQSNKYMKIHLRSSILATSKVRESEFPF